MSYKSKRVKKSLVPQSARSALRSLRRVAKSAPAQEVLDTIQDVLTVADKVTDPLVPDSYTRVPPLAESSPKRVKKQRLRKSIREAKAREAKSVAPPQLSSTTASGSVSRSSSSSSSSFTPFRRGPLVAVWTKTPVRSYRHSSHAKRFVRDIPLCNTCCPCVKCR